LINDQKTISLRARFSVTALKNLLSGNSNAPLSASLPQTIQESSSHKFYLKKTILLTIFVYFDLFWLFDFQNRYPVLFLLRYIFLKSINSGPLISHFFKITNHRPIFFWKYLFIFKSLFDWHRSIDYRFALSICPPLGFISFECPLQRRSNLTFITNISIYVINQARFRWKQSAGVVFIFSSKTRVLVWCGIKQAENGPKTSYVSDPRLSLGENVRFQKYHFQLVFKLKTTLLKIRAPICIYCSVGSTSIPSTPHSKDLIVTRSESVFSGPDPKKRLNGCVILMVIFVEKKIIIVFFFLEVIHCTEEWKLPLDI
jgi:hypothetical protein